jgi:hypothetical protein
MNRDRFSELFGNRRHETRQTEVNLRGFTINPLGGAVTPAQAQMYQAAYEQAQKSLEEPEWPLAECWN